MRSSSRSFDGRAGLVAAKVMARANRQAEAEAVAALGAEPHHRVLVLGFGPGVGVELLSERLIKAGTVELMLAPAHDLPWDDDTYDGALAVNSIQLWDPFEASVAEVARVLKPGARLVSLTQDWAIKKNSAMEVGAWAMHVAALCATHDLVEPRQGRGSTEGAASVSFSVRKFGGEDTQRPDLPQACTLGTTDGSDRVRRWKQLHDTAAPSARLADGLLQVRYRPGPGVWEELRELVAAEQVCCPFVTWEVVDHAGHPVLRVTAPTNSPDAVDSIAAMFGATVTAT